MWNGHLAGDGLGRHQSHPPVADNDMGIPPEAHAVSALASFQQGVAANYNAFSPQFTIPPVYQPAASDIVYHHHHQRGGHALYGGAPQHHVYYHGHHQLPYGSHTDDTSTRTFQHARLPQENIDGRYNEEHIRLPPYAHSGNVAYLQEQNTTAVEDAGHGERNEESEAEDEDCDDDEGDEGDAEAPPDHDTKPSAPRGKPEAMAKALAAARIEAELREMSARLHQDDGVARRDIDSDEDEVQGEMVLPELKQEVKLKPRSKVKEDKKRPAKPSKSLESSTPVKASKKRSSEGNVEKKTSLSKPKISNKLPTSSSKHEIPSSHSGRIEFLLHERVPRITDREYKNLESLMTQFCRVPLLAEFSRPVALLHPELGVAYKKIIKHPVDVGRICRGIRRRHYVCTRDVRLDVWRVFANCVRFNTHPNNKEAAPSFVSIALHLKDFFNHLWQEYMIPSDYRTSVDANGDGKANDVIKEVKRSAFNRRDEDRRKRLENSGVLVLSKYFTTNKATLIQAFIDSGGCVDCLDADPVFGQDNDDRDLKFVVANLRRYKARLDEISQAPDVEYTLDSFYHDLKDCYVGDGILEDNIPLRNLVRNRFDRFFWKQAVPLHEANSRGVSQSSIWGNIAATIWARESSKKAYWPALCLGILPPAEQREGWHDAVTERNEARLPEKLKSQLMTAKLRCEAAQKRQSLSYFLVEFLGTHEFIWVRETDIIENFDPKVDPNRNAKSSSKKSRAARKSASSVLGSKAYQTALEECVWAYEEYESVLQDAFECLSDNEGGDNDGMNYSYSLLAQSDDEADEEDDRGYMYDEDAMSVSDIDESNWLITHDGMLDTSASGRKNAKLRAMAMKKASTEKKDDYSKKKSFDAKDYKEVDPKERKESREKKKKATEKTFHRDKKESKEERIKVEKSKAKMKKEVTRLKERVEKKELRDLEKRRKKRLREREKMSRNEERKGKRRRTGSYYDSDDNERGLNRDKRARATAIVNAYLTRLAEDEDSRSLALSGVMTMPAAMVDSIGLLGMALAFRSAAGELSMPDDGEDHVAKVQPWIAVETSNPNSSSERTENLKKQIELLEKEINRLRSDTQRRRKLAEEYSPKHHAELREIESNDAAARQNHFKKRKKAILKTSDELLAKNDDEKVVRLHAERSDNNERTANLIGNEYCEYDAARTGTEDFSDDSQGS